MPKKPKNVDTTSHREHTPKVTHAYVFQSESGSRLSVLYQFDTMLVDGPGTELGRDDNVFGIPYAELRDGTYRSDGVRLGFDGNPEVVGVEIQRSRKPKKR